MTSARDVSGLRAGFTLIELLVVVAIIALLVSILLPSLRNARKHAQAVACMSNLSQVMLALRMYQDDQRGWLPQSYNDRNPYQPGSLWSESAWGVSKKDLWFYKLTPRYLGDPRTYICPGDPLAGRFDYEATPPGGAPRTLISVPSCGYGMTYVLRHFAINTDLMDAERKGPKRPANTILLGEVGPDDDVQYTDLAARADGDVGLAQPWRDGGRILWNDGTHTGYSGPTWLTARHLGAINMTTFDGAVHRVPTLAQLQAGPQFQNPECMGLDTSDPAAETFICYLCFANQADFGHYQFYKSQLWWWTGDPRKIW